MGMTLFLTLSGATRVVALVQNAPVVSARILALPYSIRKHGNAYQVVNADTGKVHAKHTTKEKAQAQVRLLHSQEGSHNVKVRRLSDGTKVRIVFKGRRRGKAKS